MSAGGLKHHVVQGKFDIATPTWTWRERWKETWHLWLTPLLGAGLIMLAAIAKSPFEWWVAAIWSLCYLGHTWTLTHALMWHRKFTDCVSDAWSEATKRLCQEMFEGGRRVGREEAGGEGESWKH